MANQKTRPWQRIFNTWRSTFSRDLSQEAPNPASTSGAGIGRADAVGGSEYLEGGSTFNHSVEIVDLNDFLEVGEHTDRRARYLEYDRLENIPEVSCITKDSIINTPNGNFTIEELMNKYTGEESFPVYCYNESIGGLTIGNAHHARWTKKDTIYEIILDDKKSIKCTGDHRVLLRNGEWKEAQYLKPKDQLMPCSQRISKDIKGYKEIYTINNGWKLTHKFIAEQTILKRPFKPYKNFKEKYEYSNHTVISITKLGQEDVYDLTTNIYHNFACNGVIIKNSSLDTFADEVTSPDVNGEVFEIKTRNREVKEELEWFFYKLLEIDTEKLWSWSRNVCKNGDLFLELIIDSDNPDFGIQKVIELPPETMYRIETVKGRLLEFQQSYAGPDYQAVIDSIKSNKSITNQTIGKLPSHSPVTTTGTMAQAAAGGQAGLSHKVIRFDPNQLIHVRLGLKRRGFYPYGVSILYAGRRVAHLLKLMEDAMVIYRLCLTGESRVRTSNGYKNIKDISPGDKAFAYHQNGSTIETLITHHVNNGIKPILKIRSKHIEQKSTYTHPFFVHDSKTGMSQYIDAQDLVPKRHQFINVSRTEEQEIVIPIFKYEYKEKLIKKQNKQYENIIDNNQINLPKFIDEDFARLFGFMLGDGNISENSISFVSGINEDINNLYSSLLEKYFGKVIFYHNKKYKYDQVGRYEVCNKIAKKIFQDLGFVSEHDKKRIPQWAFTTKRKIKTALIEGLIDADGTSRLTQTGTWTATIDLANKKMIEDVKELWSSCGLCSGHIIECDRRNEKPHEITEGRMINGDLSWCLYISKLELPKYENILSVVENGEEEVYDITVENELHNFIVNGMPSSNSRAPERRIFYIDIGHLPPNKGEEVVERVRDRIKKKKIFNRRTGSIDERWNPWAQDEDFFIPMRTDSSTRIETLPGGCLAMNTKINLLDGRTLSLQEMTQEYNNGKTNWIYSCNPKTGKIVPGLVSWAGITQKNAKVMEITIDNGKKIICTPDHKFPILGKGKVAAEDLIIGESLIPFNTRKEKIKPHVNSTYNQFYDNELKKWVFVHRIVANYFKKTELYQEKIFDNNYLNDYKDTVHHQDYNKYNNNPENLTWMNRYDHFKFHSTLGLNKTMIEIRKKGLNNYFSNLSQEEKQIKNNIAIKNFKKGNEKVISLLKEDFEFKNKFITNQKLGFKKSQKENPELWKKRGKKTARLNKKRYSNPEYKENIFKKQRIKFDQDMMDQAKNLLSKNEGRADYVLKLLNNDKNFITKFQNLNNHIKRTNFNSSEFTHNHFQKMVKNFGYKSIRELKRELNLYTFTYKNQIKFEKSLMNKAVHCLKYNKCDVLQTIKNLNSDNEFINRFKSVNPHHNVSQFKPIHFNQMIKEYGYENQDHLIDNIECYNHKIIAINYLKNEIEVGTLTIDIDEKYHDYHNFSTDIGIFVQNSNLGEIDDTRYFREKLMVALRLPKNYLFQEDPTAGRTSLATQDQRFARAVFRIQKIMASSLRSMAKKHLILKGYTEKDADDFAIKFTNPSAWLELSNSEIINGRYNLASTVKSSNMYDDFTILTKLLKHSDEDAKEIIDKIEKQMLREQEIQAQAQVYAQLASPENQEPELSNNGEENPENVTGESPEDQQATPDQEEISVNNKEDIPQTISPKTPIKKPLRFTDFADLEADEEETDENY